MDKLRIKEGKEQEEQLSSIFESARDGKGGGTLQSFIQGGSAMNINPLLTLLYTIFKKRGTFHMLLYSTRIMIELKLPRMEILSFLYSA